MNLPTADKIKHTGATCLEKLVAWNHNFFFFQPGKKMCDADGF